MSKVSFKLVCIHSGTESELIKMQSVNKKSGIVSFLDEYGAKFQRPPATGEKPASLLLNAVESYIDEKTNESKKRVFALVEYDSEFVSNNKQLQLENNLKQAMHAFVKEHNYVKVRDNNGNNINANSGSMVRFELIEESEEVRKQVEFNNKVADYSSLAKKMFEESPKAFVNFCYAYGLQNVEKTPIEKLYNEVIYKISIQPDYFNEIYNHKNRQFLALFNQALETTVNEEEIIELRDNYYYFENEPIGQNKEEAMFYFDKHPRKKDILELKLNINPETDIEPIRLPEPPIMLSSSEKEKGFREKVDAGHLQAMKSEVARLVNKFRSDLNKNRKEGISTAELEEKFLSERSRLRGKYISIEAAYDAYFEEKFNPQE
jgi:hypothetical protein